MTAHPDVFESPALPLLIQLDSDGFEFKVTGDRLLVKPVERLTSEQRALLRQEHHAAILLVRIAYDAGVQARRDAFAAHLESAPAPTVPALVFKPDVPVVPGVCWSCGEPNERQDRERPAFGRCLRCALTWRLAAKVAVPVTIAAVYDEAKRVA